MFTFLFLDLLTSDCFTSYSWYDELLPDSERSIQLLLISSKRKAQLIDGQPDGRSATKEGGVVRWVGSIHSLITRRCDSRAWFFYLRNLDAADTTEWAGYISFLRLCT